MILVIKYYPVLILIYILKLYKIRLLTIEWFFDIILIGLIILWVWINKLWLRIQIILSLILIYDFFIMINTLFYLDRFFCILKAKQVRGGLVVSSLTQTYILLIILTFLLLLTRQYGNDTVICYVYCLTLFEFLWIMVFLYYFFGFFKLQQL